MASVTFCRVPGVGGAYGAERLLVRASGLVGAYRVAARLSEHAADAYRLRTSISAKCRYTACAVVSNDSPRRLRGFGMW